MKVVKFKTEFGDFKIPKLREEAAFEIKGENTRTPAKVVSMMNELFNLENQTEEYIYEVCLDSKMVPRAIFEVTHGSVNETMVPVREFYQKALLSGAVHIIAIHNHPSGNNEPSRADDRAEEKLRKAGELIGVTLIDFIITASETGYYSYTEHERL